MDTKRPKTEEDLRRLAEKALGRVIPEDVWITHSEEGTIEEALQDFRQGRNGQTALSDFLDALRIGLKLHSRFQESNRHGKRRHQLEEPGEELTEYEVERAKVMAEHLAKYLSARKEIRNFREEILGDRLLSSSDVDTFIRSPVVCFARRFDFRRYGIPFTHHRATLIEEKSETEQGKLYYLVRYFAEPSNASIQQPFETRFSADNWAILDWVNEDLSFGQIIYSKGSLLEEIVKLAKIITEETRCDQQVAILFLLTGIAPVVQPISIQLNVHHDRYRHNMGTISMVIEPWVSAESVMKTYKKLQLYLLNRPNRPMLGRNGRWHGVDIFRFVTQRIIITPNKNKNRDDIVHLPSWSELSKIWNSVYPEYRRDRRNLYRDYKRAEQFIMFPPYRGLE